MKIQIEKDTFNSIPYLFYSIEEAKKKPLIVISHGYNCNQYEESALALQLVQKGFHVLTYDLSEHGDRYSGFLDRIDSDTDVGQSMLQIIEQSYHDLNHLVDSFKQHPEVDKDKIILIGVSIGAMLTFYTLAHNTEISAAVSLIGTPDFVEAMVYGMEKNSVEEFSSNEEIRLLKYAQKLNPIDKLLKGERRPMLIINTTFDDDVPYENSKFFYQKLKGRYDSFDGNLEFFLSDDFHVVNNEMIHYCIDWLSKLY